jgi:putative transposase
MVEIEIPYCGPNSAAKRRLAIARRFNAGYDFPIEKVPKGRLNRRVSYISSYFHCVFSTQDRRPLITPDLRDRLWPFLCGIARQNDFKALEVGGVADHVHILISLPSSMPLSKAIQLIKGGSSKWIHETFPDQRAFAWQSEYGAFSVSVSQLDKIIAYIKSQEEHHRKISFQDEFRMLLEKHQIEYDPKYLWR